MVLHNAHVIEFLQRARCWHDAALEADHWAALGDIAPIDASMLLCRFNPNEQGYDVAKQVTTDELKPEHLIRMAQRLVDIDKAEHKSRTLRDWYQTARGMGLTYHSWIDGYMEATTPPAPPVADTATPAPVLPELVETEKAGPVDKATEKPATNWRMKIQAEAYEHWIRLLASGCSPTVHSILNYMAKWCETNNVRTDSGIFPRTGHIKNTVLGGGHWMPPTISREQAKKHVAQVAQVAHPKVAQTAQ